MPQTYLQGLEMLRATALVPELRNIARGIEKESLRVDVTGHLAKTPHSPELGSALTHPHITTDYSEALLEFITPVFTDPEQCLKFLEQLHIFTCQHIGEEILWTASMPCILDDDKDIPVAQYGNSNIGQMKTIYRYGLGHRYGRRMQTIAGIHYNFSMPDAFWPIWQQANKDSNSLQDFITKSYFSMIRNFRRHNWLLLFLFGASPAACKSFLRDKDHQLEALDQYTLFKPDATSLRMGDLGYTSQAQDNFVVNYNSLEDYAETLGKALFVPHPEYQKIGLKDDNGWKQLNTNLLQIENEFYSTVRPKRTARSGETPLNALRRGGVEYIELRSIDLDPFSPLGIDLEQIYFLDAMMLYCLMECNREETVEDFQNIRFNIKQVVNFGRNTKTLLKNKKQSISLYDWSKSLLEEISECAKLLDEAHNTDAYSKSCQQQLAKLEDPSLTPSGKIIQQLQDSDTAFFPFAMKLAEQHTNTFKDAKLSAEQNLFFEKAAELSLKAQKDIEQQDSLSFEEFLRDYFERAKRCTEFNKS